MLLNPFTPLKNIFFLAVMKLGGKDSFGYNKEIED